MKPVFHLVVPDAWPRTGLYRPASLAAEGFVHLSFLDQVLASADRHFADVPALLAVELDPRLLGDPIRVEDSYGTGTSYPHLYGPVPVAAAVAVQPLGRGADGRWTFSPPGGAAAAASPGQ